MPESQGRRDGGSAVSAWSGIMLERDFPGEAVCEEGQGRGMFDCCLTPLGIIIAPAQAKSLQLGKGWGCPGNTNSSVGHQTGLDLLSSEGMHMVPAPHSAQQPQKAFVLVKAQVFFFKSVMRERK